MRTDGPFIEAGENDNLIVQRLQSDPNALGIFGYSFVYENLDTIEGVALRASSRTSTPSPTSPSRWRVRSTSTSRTRTAA